MAFTSTPDGLLAVQEQIVHLEELNFRAPKIGLSSPVLNLCPTLLPDQLQPRVSCFRFRTNQDYHPRREAEAIGARVTIVSFRSGLGKQVIYVVVIYGVGDRAWVARFRSFILPLGDCILVCVALLACDASETVFCLQRGFGIISC